MAESKPPTQPWWHDETIRRVMFAKGYHEADISRLAGCVRSVNARLNDAYASPDTVISRITDLVRVWRRELESHLEASYDPRLPMVRTILTWTSPTDTAPDDDTVLDLLARWDDSL